jgi:hypothetical protein
MSEVGARGITRSRWSPELLRLRVPRPHGSAQPLTRGLVLAGSPTRSPRRQSLLVSPFSVSDPAAHVDPKQTVERRRSL